MPRIPPSTLRRAYRISPHAATLLPATRDLPSALNELRWIREHVREQQLGPGKGPLGGGSAEHHVAALCRRRGRGVPLQYVLGTQPFGGLDMRCRPGVLIPRPEPEAYTTHLAGLIRRGLLSGTPSTSPSPSPSPSISPQTRPKTLRILDLCTGTGCIALLLYSLLHPAAAAAPDLDLDLHARGVDVSPRAVRLARKNAGHNVLRGLMPEPRPPRASLAFGRADIFSDALLDELAGAEDNPGGPPAWDVIVCNPPYVSHWGFAHQTARGVRNYEPKIAQVPMVTYGARGGGGGGGGGHEPEDVFYARLLDIGARLGPRVMLFEVGDLGQALRVVEMALGHKGLGGLGREVRAEVWRDWPDATPEGDEETTATVCNGSRRVQIKGSGHGRSVFIQCR